MSDFWIETMNMENQIKPIADEVFSSDFPWYYQPISTSYKFPFMSHTVVPRHEEDEELIINSKMFLPCVNIVEEFCSHKNIALNKILRIHFNMTFSFIDNKCTDAHVDYDFNHSVLIMYFTNNNGKTILFDKVCTEGDSVFIKEQTLSVKKEITPEFGKIIAFNGRYFHAHEFCKAEDRRIVCVACFN